MTITANTLNSITSLILPSSSNFSITSRSIFTPRPGQNTPEMSSTHAPRLALYERRSDEALIEVSEKKSLHLVPQFKTTSQGDLVSELPPLEVSISRYVLGLVEILGGRRQPMQLARLSHRIVYARIVELAGSQREIPKIRKFYISEPAPGVSETTVTLRLKDRVRSLAMRFESSDNRWLCTDLSLL